MAQPHSRALSELCITMKMQMQVCGVCLSLFGRYRTIQVDCSKQAAKQIAAAGSRAPQCSLRGRAEGWDCNPRVHLVHSVFAWGPGAVQVSKM